MKRIDWMKGAWYEVVGTTKRTRNASASPERSTGALFSKRTCDFAANDGVMLFQVGWYSVFCSQPDHGHPVGIYSRRAGIGILIDSAARYGK